MRKLLRFLTFLVAPLPYPYVGLYHFLVGAAGLWWLSGAHHSHVWQSVLVGGGVGWWAGLVGYLVFGYSVAKLEAEAE
ncbi:hypothetical protein [uncultured Hymenobacter sp.]|uniref:hypothetical protein n=1 Tax=uncultured Hymenobacter sp. TaxID=170016 RepID=UPI0035CBE5E2